jgi:F0F1-type ATP synthase epsilon subunit
MSKSFHLTVLTPDRALLEAERVTEVHAQLADGAPIGIYPGHAPLLAETVAEPLRYADRSGEHAIDLGAGILRVSEDSVTVFANQTSEVWQTPEVSEDDEHFDRLARDLLAKLNAQPENVLDIEPQAEGNRT